MFKSRTCLFVLFIQLFLSRHACGQQPDSLFRTFRDDAKMGWDDDTRESYYLLMLTGPVAALVRYMDDSIPTVRANIFAGLVGKSADEETLRNILKRHENDTAKFTQRSGCVGMGWTVKGYMQFMLEYRQSHKNTRMDYRSLLANTRSRKMVMIPGIRHGMIDKQALLQLNRLTYPLAGVEIVSFKLTIGDTSFKGANQMTSGMRNRIKALGAGDPVFFDDIKASVPDHTLRNMGSIVLKIKE